MIHWKCILEQLIIRDTEKGWGSKQPAWEVTQTCSCCWRLRYNDCLYYKISTCSKCSVLHNLCQVSKESSFGLWIVQQHGIGTSSIHTAKESPLWEIRLYGITRSCEILKRHAIAKEMMRITTLCHAQDVDTKISRACITAICTSVYGFITESVKSYVSLLFGNLSSQAPTRRSDDFTFAYHYDKLQRLMVCPRLWVNIRSTKSSTEASSCEECHLW